MAFSSTLSQLNAFFRHRASGAELDFSGSSDHASDSSSAAQSSVAPGASLAEFPSLRLEVAPATPGQSQQPRQQLGSTIVGSNGSLRFKLIWDNSVANGPKTAFEKAIIQAAKFYAAAFNNNELITVHVGWGEVDGQPLGADALGSSITNEKSLSYATVYNGLKRDDGLSSYQTTADNSLPFNNPLHNANFGASIAEYNAWGMGSPNGGANNGWIGLANYSQLGGGSGWNFTQSNFGRNQFDAVGTAEHELSEVMGRFSDVGNYDGWGSYSPLDLFRYSANGVRDLHSGNGSAYFSIDKGAQNLGTYNNNPNNGDLGDWTGSVVGNSYGDGAPGRPGLVTPHDVIEMAALGYNLTAYGKSIA